MLTWLPQLPTFPLSLSTLFPRTRSNTLFALSFIATRIVFHLVLVWEFALGGCVVFYVLYFHSPLFYALNSLFRRRDFYFFRSFVLSFLLPFPTTYGDSEGLHIR
jgi:hypothetical protein